MTNIEARCEMLDTDIDELKAEILGEMLASLHGVKEEGKLDDLISLAKMLGEAYVYRDNIVTPKVKTEEV